VTTLHLIEEFLNTIDERRFSRYGEQHVGGERLTSPQALHDWLRTHDLAVESVSPADLTAALAVRTALRESAALDDFPLRIVPDPDGGLRLSAGTGRPWLDTIVETVAVSVARGDWSRIKLCAAPDCRWAFHDTSRSGRGRWCSMDVCGNRHKTRTYRERHQQA
jgi:predicted RNA-binding Zn ribbon-like protein